MSTPNSARVRPDEWLRLADGERPVAAVDREKIAKWVRGGRILIAQEEQVRS